MRRTTATLAVIGIGLALLGANPGPAGAGQAVRSAPLSSSGGSPSETCPALAGMEVPPSEIGLPSNGAVVESAELVPSSGRPEYCRVRGSVMSVDPAAPDIFFQINLPSAWNRGSVQLGGGGFNGVVVNGLGNVPGTAGASEPLAPLDRGYVTFGSDSGNAVGSNPAGSFGLNQESLENYSGDSIKRTRDAAMSLIKAYYGEVPGNQYFAGGSKGGHEGLIAAQDYGSDYDGIIAYYPANQNQAMVISWDHIYQMWNRPGGSLNSAEAAFVEGAVMASCDSLDGLTDGVIANTAGCERTFEVSELRCSGGQDLGDACLSQTQIETVLAASSPFKFAFKLSNHVNTMAAYPFLRGASFGTIPFYGFFNDPVIKYFIKQDPTATTAGFNYTDYKQRIKELSKLLDATDPNVNSFARRGGKLIMVQGTTDQLVTAGTTSAYYDKLEDRYGKRLGTFARYYVQPGYGHGDGAFTLSWDSLTALEKWTQQGQAPVAPVAVDANPQTVGRQMPLCDYPTWPKYVGGLSTLESSFVCTS
jgi:hypothetical protein